jgi:hypothetical protein
MPAKTAKGEKELNNFIAHGLEPPLSATINATGKVFDGQQDESTICRQSAKKMV